MSFWNFVGGAAKKLASDREQQGAEARELEQWKKRIEFQEKLQRQFEEQKAKNRIIAEGVDSKTGEIYSVTAGGNETRTRAPEALIRAKQAEEQAALDKALRDQQKFEADIKAKGSSASASEAAAKASLASIARLGSRAASQNALDQARIDNYKNGGGKPSEQDKAAERDIAAAFTTITRSERSPEVKAAAERIRFSNLSPAEKRQALTELLEAED
jgi:hypothetical protein